MRHQLEENISKRNSSVKNLVCMEKEGDGEKGKKRKERLYQIYHHKTEKDG